MDSRLIKILDAISAEDLEGKELCAFCFASGIPLESCLHQSEDMRGGPISSDSKCAHCYDTEEEYGRFGRSKQLDAAFALQTEFNQYKEQRLKTS